MLKQERTRILGPELVDALARVDELLEAHDSNKGHKWLDQTWQEHLLRAIVHFSVAIRNAEDGAETEAAHGACRALMGLQKIICDPEIERKECKLHAGPPASQIFSSASWFGGVPTVTIERPQPRDPMMSVCTRHGYSDCEFCGYHPTGTP
jgi:hypothetical protein